MVDESIHNSPDLEKKRFSRLEVWIMDIKCNVKPLIATIENKLGIGEGRGSIS